MNSPAHRRTSTADSGYSGDGTSACLWSSDRRHRLTDGALLLAAPPVAADEAGQNFSRGGRGSAVNAITGRMPTDAPFLGRVPCDIMARAKPRRSKQASRIDIQCAHRRA